MIDPMVIAVALNVRAWQLSERGNKLIAREEWTGAEICFSTAQELRFLAHQIEVSR